MRWWARLVRRSRVERELDAELRYHYDRRVDELVDEGLSVDAARRTARLEFGGLDQIKEMCRDARGTRWLEDLAVDTRYALRLLRKDRWFAAVAIGALGLGIAVNNTQFTIVDSYCLRGLPIERPDRVAFVATHDRSRGDGPVSYADFIDMRRSTTAFGGMAAATTASVSLADAGRAADSVLAAYISVATLRLLGRAPAVGRDFADADAVTGAPVAVLLSSRVWQARYAADAAIVGRPARINGSPAVIVGVMPDGFTFPDHPDVWLPLEHMAGIGAARRDDRKLSVFARLREGSTFAQANAELAAIGARLAAAYPDADAALAPIAEPINVHYNGRITDPAWKAFTIVGLLVVVIACANVANLMLMRAAGRAREAAMRAALGATRLRIVRQLLVESTVLAIAGGGVGLALSAVALQLFIHAVPPVAIPYGGLSVNGDVLAVLLAVAIGTVLLFGLAPAVTAVPADVGAALKTGSLSVTHDRRVRRWTAAFMTVEFGLTVLLVSGVGLSMENFRRADGEESRIEIDRLLTVRLAATAERYRTAASRRDLYDRLHDRLAAIPGATVVSFSNTLGLAGPPSDVVREGDPAPAPAGRLKAATLAVDAEYFRALGPALTRGRPFGVNRERSGDREVLVNERLAHLLFPDGAAIGRRIRVDAEAQDGHDAPWRMIVGIAPDLRHSPGAAPDAILYLPFDALLPVRPALLIQSAADPAALAPAVREQIRLLDADLPIVSLQTARQAERDAGWNRRMSMNIIGTIAFVAVMLAAVGLYAVTAYGVARRTREIGIRIALGARARRVVWLVLRGTLLHVFAGLAAGLLMKNLWGRLFGGPGAGFDPANLLSIVIVLGAVAIVATVAPAARALRINPLEALRAE
jgi:putative ABC transport system permease protein